MCIERDATLMFHGGHDIQEDITGPDTRASRAMLYRYNEALRRYLREGHYMDSDEYHTLMGSELITASVTGNARAVLKAKLHGLIVDRKESGAPRAHVYPRILLW
jgi:hypothetical protein